MNLLIVDDDPTSLKLLRTQLESEGHAVVEAHDGVDALALLEHQRVNAVITDVLMPRLDGYRLCHEIRKHARLYDLPVIIYTSTYTSPGDEKLALDVGADKYLKKPVSVEIIIAALNEVIAVPHTARHPKALQEFNVPKEYSEKLVSKLKEKNAELQAAEVKFRALVEQSIVGIYIIQDERFVYVNPGMQKIFGWSEAEMTSRTIYDFIVPEDHALARENIHDRISGAVQNTVYVLRVLHQSGAVLQVEVHSSLTDYNGRPAVMGMLVDITGRKRAEEAAQRSQKRLRDLIDGLGPSMFVGLMTLQGILIEANRPALAAAGLKPEGVLGKPFEETYWWAYSQEVQQQLREAIARAVRGEASRYDVQLRAAENHLIDVDFSLEPLRDETGEVVFLVPSANVITERKQTENALRASEARLRAIIDNEPECVQLVDKDGLILEMNPAGLRMIEADSLPQVQNQNINSILVEEHRAAFRALLGKTLRGESGTLEFDIIGLKGTRRTLDTHAVPLRDATGAVTSMLGITRDITERKAAAESLRLQSATLHAATDAIVITDRAGVMEWVNPAFTQLTGYTAEEAFGKKLGDLVKSGKHAPAFYKEFWETILAGRAWHGEIINRRKDGGLYIEDQVVTPILDASGATTHFVAIRRDITERKAAENRIRRLNRVYAVLSGINALIVRVRDRDELFREACRIAVETGAFRMAWIGLVDPDTRIVHPAASFGDHDEEYLQGIEISVAADSPFGQGPTGTAIRENQPVWSQDFQNDPRTAPWHERGAGFGWGGSTSLPLHRNGGPVGVLTLYTNETGFFDDEEKKLLTELAGDIAFAIDHIDKQERLNYLAYYDVLTGLANRSLFLERVAQYMRSAVSAGHKLAVFLIDLERFKNINDSLGQPAGDSLLKQVAQWLTHNAAEDVNLLAHVGADHFALVMPVVKQGGNLMRLLEKWTKAFQEHPFRLNDAVFRIAAKVGVAVFPDDGADADTLFKNAEAALKQAKASGERYLCYTQKMTEAVAGKLTLENQLRQALDNGEFVLHYQPKVNLVSGKLTSAEALIRWNDPRTGLVPPGRFIPILEETGLIYEVGRWALHQAIADYLRWRAAGLPAVRIAVNVSPLQLRNRGFIAEIEQVIGVDANAAAGLELEITESLIMEDVKHNIASLQAIRAMGVTIAIDDFGTGFSSLSYLAKLPVDTLKIDRSFVIDMTTGPEGLALVSTIINLAHSLKLKVVAEGVETEEQSSLLRLLNCEEMQGFLSSKPVPGEIFETRFLQRVLPYMKSN